MKIEDCRIFGTRSGRRRIDVEKLSKGLETSRNGFRCGIISQHATGHPESRGENDTCSACCGSHELTPRQHGAFPKVCVANIVMAVVRLLFHERVSWWDNQLLLLSRHSCETKKKTNIQDALQPECDRCDLSLLADLHEQGGTDATQKRGPSFRFPSVVSGHTHHN